MQGTSRRTGLVAEKLGMTQVFDTEGKSIAVTVLRANGNTVIANKTKDKNGYTSVVMGFGEAKPHRVSKSVRGICAKANVKPTKIIKEFRVSEDALVAAGSEILVTHYIPNQYVDIHGTSTGKGFAGGMKRWNFRGLEASHGVSVSHRSIGSTGQRQDPGKTFKGKKMPGHLGADTVTLQNLKVVRIDEELGLILVNGSVPGKKGSIVTITDAVKLSMPANVAYPAAVNQAKAQATPEVKAEHVAETASSTEHQSA